MKLLYNKHNMHVTCPYCGAGQHTRTPESSAKKTRLPQYLPVVLLAEKNGDLYASILDAQNLKLDVLYKPKWQTARRLRIYSLP